MAMLWTTSSGYIPWSSYIYDVGIPWTTLIYDVGIYRGLLKYMM